MNDVPVVEPTTRPACPAELLIDSLANGEDVENPTEPVKLFVLENVFESDSSVEEANVQVDVEYE
jgi:hypothetical protein